MIEYRDIQPISGNRLHYNTVYNADVTPNTSIRLFGTFQGKEFDITFKIGETAEYDSYNRKYVGKILKIGQKTVTINGSSTGEGNRRLSLYEFTWRNCDFNLEKIERDNHEHMMSS